MPDIPYLTGNEPITAESRNLIFAEADRKLSAAMDDHSLLFIYNLLKSGTDPSPIYGRKFFFTAGTPRFMTRFFSGEDGFTSYNHATFDAATAAATTHPQPISYDVAKKLLAINNPDVAFYTAAGITPPSNELFNYSLAVHSKKFTPPDGVEEDYNLLVPTVTGNEDAQWEREHLYESVEIILEGTASASFPATWNKYKFFRLHNLGAGTAVVMFQGGPAVSIPARGSRCIRRDNGVYTEGYNHFHKMLPGDARMFEAGTSPVALAGIHAPSNNVFNQRLIADLCAKFQQLDSPHFNIDPRKFWDAKSVYCNPNYVGNSEWGRATPAGGYFGDPDNPATKLGDLMFHKGKILDLKITGTLTEKQEIEFRGFDTISADFAAKGVSVSYDFLKNLTLTSADGSTRDMVGISTNLIADGGQLPQTAPAFQMRPTLGNLGHLVQAYWSTGGIAASSTGVSGGGVSISFPLTYNTIANFFLFGSDPRFSYSQPASDYTAVIASDTGNTVSEKKITMTGFGPIFTFTRTISAAHRTRTPASVDQTTVFNANRTLATLEGAGYVEPMHARFSTAAPVDVFTFYSQTSLSWPSWTGGDLMRNFFRADQLYGTKIVGSTGRTIFNSAYSTFAGATAAHPAFTEPLKSSPAAEASVKNVNAIAKTGAALLSGFSYAGNKLGSILKFFRGEASAPFGSGNTSSPDWYRVNRNWFLLSNSTVAYIDPNGGIHAQRNIGDGGSATTDTQVGATFDFFLETIDTYNNLASIVNGIVSVVPLHFLAVYPELVYNGAGIGAFNVRPLHQYMKVTIGSAIHAELVSLGVPIKDITELPGTWQELVTKKNRFYSGAVFRDGDHSDLVSATFALGEGSVNAAAGGMFLNSDWRTNLFGAPFTPPTIYHWVKIQDVEAAASAIGLKLYCQVVSVPMKLEFFESAGSTGGVSAFYPARFAAFVADEGGDWIKDADTVRVRQSFTAGRYLRAHDGHIITSADRYLRRNWTGRYATAPLYEPDRHREVLLFQNFAPSNGSRVLHIPENSINWTNFAAITPGDMRPSLVTNPSVGTSSQQSLGVGNTFITATSVCDRLQFFIDNRVSV